jgi:hypothetical protein
LALLRPRAFATIVLFVALALALGSTFVVALKVDPLTSLAALTLADGPVFVRHGDGDFQPAREGDVVVAGDTVRIGSRASAELTYFEGSSIRLEPEAELVVASLRADRGPVIGATQALARAWHVVSKLVSGNTRYDPRGPSSTASVRG